jgi:hypothetical protein
MGNPWDASPIVRHAGAATAGNPKLPLELTHSAGENIIQNAEIGRQGSITSKAQSDAARAAADAREALARAHVAAPLSAAQLTKAQADAALAQQKVDETRANAALSTMTANSDLHGEAYLKKFVPQSMWNVVKAYARGDLGSRSGGLSTSMLPIIQHAMNYDPAASGTNFPARVKMQSDLASGDPKSAGGSLQAFERMLLHGENVLDSGLKLKNYHSGIGSGALNGVRSTVEGWNQNPNLATFNEEVRNYAPEAQKAIASVAGGEGERLSRAGAFTGSVSPEALAAGLQADARQAYGAMQSVNDRYRRLMGHDILGLLSPNALRAYNKIMSGGLDEKTGKALHPADGFTPIDAANLGGGGPPGSGGSLNFNGDGSGVNDAEVDNAPPGSYEKFRSDLETGINSGRITTVEQAQQFARDNGGFKLGDPKVIQANIDQVGTGRKANVASPTTEVSPALSGPQSAMANYAGAMTFDTLPKVSAGLSALNQRITSNTPLSVGELYARQLDANRGQMNQAFSDHPIWSAAGTAAGIGAGENIASSVPGIARALNFLPEVARAPAADAAYSGLMGAGGADWSNPANVGTNAVLGTLAGGAGSAGGNVLARTAGMAFRGVTNPAVRYLRQAGVPMTVGQVLGGFPKKLENSLTSVFPQIGNRYTEGFQGFNRAGFNQGLEPINGLAVNGLPPMAATTNGTIGPAGVDLARGARTQAYSNTLDPVSLVRDAQFGADETAVRGLAGGLPDDMANRANYAIDRAGQNFSPQDELTGGGFQQAIRRFRRAASQNAPLPNGDDLGDVMQQAQGAYNGLVSRQAPDILPAYQAANEANRNVSVLQGAVNRARNGGRSGEVDVFTPSQLADEAAANSRRYGGTQGTTEQPFFDLTRAGQQVLPSTVPDSGSATRLAALALPGMFSGAGAGTGYAAGDTRKGTAVGLGLGTLLALGGGRTSQRALTSLLLERPDFLRALGGQFIDRAPVGGMFGAGLGAGLAPALVPQR